MSSKATEKKSAGTEVTHEERWRSGRPRFFGRQNVHLGRDKKWHFSGQQADEEVHLVVRKHWWFLVKPALPFIASCILLGLVLFATVRFPNPLFSWNRYAKPLLSKRLPRSALVSSHGNLYCAMD